LASVPASPLLYFSYMSIPLRAARRVTNDVRPARSSAAAPRTIRTITLTYRPAKPVRFIHVLFAVVLCCLTGASAWYASKAFALYIAARTMIAEARGADIKPALHPNDDVKNADIILPAEKNSSALTASDTAP
jgi:hypothetical protein